MAYVSASEVKAYLGINTSTEDALISSLMERAQGIIDAYTGRKFEAETATRYFDGNFVDGQDLNLWGYDLLGITALTNGDETIISSADYRLFPRNDNPKWTIRLNSDKSWNLSGDAEISIAGTWGYAATAPFDIVHACIRLTAFLYRQKDTSADIDRPMITGDGVTIMPSGLPADVQKLLDRYKRKLAI